MAVLEYMLHCSCRRVSKILSLAYEPIGKSGVHYLSRISSSRVVVASKPGYRMRIAVDDTKLCVMLRASMYMSGLTLTWILGNR